MDFDDFELFPPLAKIAVKKQHKKIPQNIQKKMYNCLIRTAQLTQLISTAYREKDIVRETTDYYILVIFLASI